jgi:hypothetical protein
VAVVVRVFISVLKLEMVGVTTWSVTADVIDFVLVGNVAYKDSVGKSVCELFTPNVQVKLAPGLSVSIGAE